MNQASDQIKTHIENTREDLKSNLEELETKVKSATDWRHYFRQNPWLATAAAFGAGILLSALIGKDKQRTAVASSSPPDAVRASGFRHGALDAWDTVKSALLSVAAIKIKEMLSAPPGSSEHLPKAEGDRDYRAAEERNH